MKFLLSLLVFLLVSLNHSFNQAAEERSANTANVMIQSPDIVISYKMGSNDEIKIIEAFRSPNNDMIFHEKRAEMYGQLEWQSLGYPFLTKPPRNTKAEQYESNTLSDMFTMTKSGFFIYMDMLDFKQKQAIKEQIQQKYAVSVGTSQILMLVPSEVRCSIKVICKEDNKNFTLKGRAKDVHELPIKISFRAPYKSRERKCFEMDLIEHEEMDIECHVFKHSKTAKVNKFSIKSTQISQFGIDDKLFGDANEIYVTRKQMADLSAELYAKLDVYEDYEMEENEFSQSIMEELIKKTADGIFEPIPFDQGFSALSSYNSDDLKPDVIKSEMSKMFKVETVGNKTHIKVAREQSDSQSQSSKDEKSVDGGLNIAGFGLSGNYGKMKERSNSWANSNKNLNEQLTELNNEMKDDAQFEFDGEKIVPKSLNLCKLVKSKFKKDLTFEKIRRVVKEAQFKKTFALEYTGKPKETYKHIWNRFINDSSNSLEKMSFNSLITCFKACNELVNCHFVDINERTSECSLYDQRGNFNRTKPREGVSRRIYQRKGYTAKTTDGVRLAILNETTSDSVNVFKKNSSESCWQQCLQSKWCVAISFNQDTEVEENCLLFERDKYTLSEDDEFQTISYENENIEKKRSSSSSDESESEVESNENENVNNEDDFLVKSSAPQMLSSQEKVIVENLKVYGKPIKNSVYSIADQIDCWNECVANNECSIVSYCSSYNGECTLYKLMNDTEYFVFTNASYVTITKLGVTLSPPTNVTFHAGKTFHYYLKNLDSVTNEIACWQECSKETLCVASTYFASNNKCQLFTSSQINLIRNETSALTMTSGQVTLQDRAPISIYPKKQLLSAIRILKNLTDLPSCWSECLETRGCEATSFCGNCSSSGGPSCEMFSKSSGFEWWNEDNFTTISLGSTGPVEKMLEVDLSKKIKLYNHYKGPIKTASYFECWSECTRNREEKCIAVSYCSKTGECFLYKKDEYLVTKNSSFITMSYANEGIVKTTNDDSTTTFVDVYVNQQIRNFYYKLVKSRNVRECWLECRGETKTNCRAVMFNIQNSLQSCQTRTCDCYLIAPLKTRINNMDKYYTIDSIFYISVGYKDEPFKKLQQQWSNNYSG